MKPQNIELAFSSCPNDTYIFAAIAEGWIDCEGLTFRIMIEDVESLNQKAMKGIPDMVKVSYHAWIYLQQSYVLLESGSAMGSGTGPLLIAKKPFTDTEIGNLTVAIPGEFTTAHLLFKLAYPEAKLKRFMVFSEIEDAILSGDVDAGVIIHENRFTYENKGLVKLRDLGDWWEAETGSVIPLGGIVARRSMGYDTINRLNRIMRRSVEFAMAGPARVMPFVRQHAREMDDQVILKHIGLYVNDYTLELGEKGKKAISEMENRVNERNQ